jgi:hypothetical protein
MLFINYRTQRRRALPCPFVVSAEVGPPFRPPGLINRQVAGGKGIFAGSYPALRLLFSTGGSALLRGILCKHQFHGLCPPLCASSIPRRGVAHHTVFFHSGKILFYFQESFIRLHPYGIIKLQY